MTRARAAIATAFALTAVGAPAAGAETLLASGAPVGRIHLRWRGSRTVTLVAGADVVAPGAAHGPVTLTLQGVGRDVDGPLAQGARVGRVLVRAGGAAVGSAPALTQSPVPLSTLGQRLRDVLGKPLTGIALAMLAGCSLLLTHLRVRAARRAR